MELTSGRTKVTIDPRTGSILRIQDDVAGHVHLDAHREGRDDARLFRVVIPADSWWSCYADSQNQTQVECVRHGDGVVLAYPNLRDADGRETGVAVKVEIRPGELPDEFRLSMHVANRGPRDVLDTTFPLLGGWHDQGERSRIALGANSIIAPRSLEAAAGNNYARNGRRKGWHYPVELACPWVDVSGPGGGLAYLNYMTEGRNGKFWIENLAGYGNDFRLMFGWAHMIALRPGDSWTSPPMGLAAHGSDWTATVERYRAWFDARRPPDYSRPGIRSRIGFQNVFFRGFDGTPIRPLEVIPQVAAAGRRYGVDMLCVWDTLTLGNYARHNPRDLTDYGPEERELLSRGLRQAEEDGTRTCALINFRHPNVALHLSAPDLPERVQRRYTGTFRTENWTGNHTFGDLWAKHIGPESYVFSPFSPAHRERVLQLTRDYLDLGYRSMFYDQPFEIHPDYGFIGSGQPPGATHHEALKLVGAVRDLLLSRDAEAVVIGEECDIHATPYIDQWMSWSIAAPSPSLVERVAMMRYAMPHTILSWVVDHELERAALAFMLGMQLCLMVHGGEGTLEDEPEFGEYVAALARLRRATSHNTTMARFVNQRGLHLDCDEGFLAFAYDSPRGPTVIVGAPEKAACGRVSVDLSMFTASGSQSSGRIIRLDGSQTGSPKDTYEFSLAAHEVAVWSL